MVWVLLDWKAMMTMLSWQRRRHQKSTKGKSFPFFPSSRIFDLWAAAECFWGRERGSQSNESIIFQSQKGLPPSLACSRHANIRMQLTRLLPPPWHFQALPTHSFPRKFPALPREKRGKILVACFFFLLLPCEPLLLHFSFLHFLIQ